MEYDFSKEAELPGKIQYDFSELPEEIQRLYLLKLPVKDIANYCVVNPSVHKICTDDYFWLLKVDHDFPGVYQYKPKDITYQQQFLDLLRIKYQTEAAREGRIDILIYLESQEKLRGVVIVMYASEYGHLDVLKWLKTKGIYDIEYIVTYASKGGYINILEWVGPEGIPYYQKGANYAVSGRQIGVLEWFEAHGILPTDVNVADDTAASGRINVLNWLEQRRIFPTVIGANRAARNGQINVLNWLEHRGIFPNIDAIKSIIHSWNIPSAVDALHRDGSRFDVLNWLYDRNIYPDIESIEMAVKSRNIDLLEWLEKRGFYVTQQIINNIPIHDIRVREWLVARGIFPNQ